VNSDEVAGIRQKHVDACLTRCIHVLYSFPSSNSMLLAYRLQLTLLSETCCASVDAGNTNQARQTCRINKEK